MPVVGNTSTTSKDARNSPTAVSILTKITLTHNDISQEIAPDEAPGFYFTAPLGEINLTD